MSALVPDHVGISSIDQPTIYWFIRKPTKLKVIFTLRLEPVAGGSIDDLITDEDLDKEDEDEDNEVSKLDGILDMYSGLILIVQKNLELLE